MRSAAFAPSPAVVTGPISGKTGTALVRVGPDDQERNGAAMTVVRGYAPFVAQLIATASNAPQTRRLRRAPLRTASAAYRSIARLV
jgi:cell division protein FtsI/penicillin-binding protein 2